MYWNVNRKTNTIAFDIYNHFLPLLIKEFCFSLPKWLYFFMLSEIDFQCSHSLIVKTPTAHINTKLRFLQPTNIYDWKLLAEWGQYIRSPSRTQAQYKHWTFSTVLKSVLLSSAHKKRNYFSQSVWLSCHFIALFVVIFRNK